MFTMSPGKKKKHKQVVAADQRTTNKATTNKFKHSQEFLENKFEINDLIETRDHENEELICLAKVADKDGPRILVELLATYGKTRWKMIDSCDIFPVGTCEKEGKNFLQPPLGCTKTNYISYKNRILRKIKEEDSEEKAASKECFYQEPETPEQNYFEVGEKIEAVCKNNLKKSIYIVHPATISNVYGDMISVCIDGWKGTKDYECFYYDRDIYPLGYHSKYGITLQDEGTEGNDPKVDEFIKKSLKENSRKTRSKSVLASSTVTVKKNNKISMPKPPSPLKSPRSSRRERRNARITMPNSTAYSDYSNLIKHSERSSNILDVENNSTKSTPSRNSLNISSTTKAQLTQSTCKETKTTIITDGTSAETPNNFSSTTHNKVISKDTAIQDVESKTETDNKQDIINSTSVEKYSKNQNDKNLSLNKEETFKIKMEKISIEKTKNRISLVNEKANTSDLLPINQTVTSESFDNLKYIHQKTQHLEKNSQTDSVQNKCSASVQELKQQNFTQKNKVIESCQKSSDKINEAINQINQAIVLKKGAVQDIGKQNEKEDLDMKLTIDDSKKISEHISCSNFSNSFETNASFLKNNKLSKVSQTNKEKLIGSIKDETKKQKIPLPSYSEAIKDLKESGESAKSRINSSLNEKKVDQCKNANIRIKEAIFQRNQVPPAKTGNSSDSSEDSADTSTTGTCDSSSDSTDSDSKLTRKHKNLIQASTMKRTESNSCWPDSSSNKKTSSKEDIGRKKAKADKLSKKKLKKKKQPKEKDIKKLNKKLKKLKKLLAKSKKDKKKKKSKKKSIEKESFKDLDETANPLKLPSSGWPLKYQMFPNSTVTKDNKLLTNFPVTQPNFPLKSQQPPKKRKLSQEAVSENSKISLQNPSSEKSVEKLSSKNSNDRKVNDWLKNNASEPETIVEESKEKIRPLNPKLWSLDQTMDYIVSKEKSLCKYLPYLKEQRVCGDALLYINEQYVKAFEMTYGAKYKLLNLSLNLQKYHKENVAKRKEWKANRKRKNETEKVNSSSDDGSLVIAKKN